MKTRFLKSFTFRIFSVTSLVLLISLAALTLVNSYSLSRRETEQQIYSGTNTLTRRLLLSSIGFMPSRAS